MAIVSFDIPTAAVNRVNDAFAAEFGWTAELGLTKAQFTKSKVIEYVKQVTRNYEANIAASQARTTVNSEIDGINIT